MSTDAQYILDYEVNSYLKPTPMEIDKKFLEDKYGGEVEFITSFCLFWDNPKYTLLPDDVSLLMADRVLEKRSCDLFEIIK